MVKHDKRTELLLLGAMVARPDGSFATIGNYISGVEELYRLIYVPDHLELAKILFVAYHKRNYATRTLFLRAIEESSFGAKRTNALTALLGAAYKAYSEDPTALGNLDTICKRLYEFYMRRKIGAELDSAYQTLMNSPDPFEVVRQIEGIADKVLSGLAVANDKATTTVDMGESVSVVQEIDKRRQGLLQESILGLGFKEVDASLAGGLREDDYLVIAARPSIGKTALALSMITQMAIKRGLRIMFFTLEMSAKKLIYRILAQMSGVPLMKMMNPMQASELTETDIARLRAASTMLSDSKIIIEDVSSLTLTTLENRLASHLREGPIHAVCLDYLQLMEVDEAYRSREEVVSKFSRNFKKMAMRYKVPQIVLAQLNRDVESRSEKRPRLSDLRESGSIEQDADAVILIHRPEFYKIDTLHDGSSSTGRAELIVAKARNGHPGTAIVDFDAPVTWFHDSFYSDEEIEEQRLKNTIDRFSKDFVPHPSAADKDDDDEEDLEDKF